MNNGGDLWFHSKRGRNSRSALTPLEEAEKLNFVSEFDRIRAKGPLSTSDDIFDTPVAHAQARNALPKTLKSIEEHGYLYHYAPREARESILEEGLLSSKARTKGALGAPVNSLYFFTDPDYAPSAHLMMTKGEDLASQKSPIVDMYRIKIEPGMLDNAVVDARLPILDGRGSSVILSPKSGAVPVELIAENVFFQETHPHINPHIRNLGGYIAPGHRDFLTHPKRSKPQAILPVTQQGKPVMNIPGHGQVIDPIEIATRRAQRQADLDEAFNPIQINQRVNAQRKAALPGKKLNKAQRRAAKNARALEVQKQREEGSKLARAEAERLKAERAAQQVTQPTTVSLSGAAKDRSTLGVTGEVRSKPIYVNPVTRQREGRPEFVGNRKGRLKVGQTREGSIDTRRIAGFEISIDGVPSHSLLHDPIIDAPTYEAYGSISDGSPKKIGMSEEEATEYISKRVDLDGGTLARNKSLPGFGQGVKDIVDQGILSKEEVSKIVQSKNVLELTPNAGQVADTLDLEELYRLSYGQALSASQQGVGMGKGEQIKIGRAIGLGEKQTMMVDHENLVKGHNAALQELYDADRAQKIADGARNQQNIQATKLADKEQRIAADNLAKAERKKAEKVQAVISRGSSTVGETIIPSRLAPAAEQAEEVVRKAPISKRTMEKMMSSNMLAAGVAAGGLGLLYASNKMRGEREVGR